MKLSGKKLTAAILAGLMGATMFGGSVFAEVSDQEFNEVRQGVNSNTARISQLENAQSTAKDYSTDIAANAKAVADETKARQDADTKLQGSVDANAKAVADETKARQDADTKLQGSVDANAKAIANEATARTEADTNLDKRITSVKDYLEKQTAADYVSKTDAAVQNGAVAKADKTIGENVTNLDGALAKETAARIGADAAQDKVIQQVNQNVAKGFNDLNQNIGKITDQLNKNDLVEAQARDAADQKLQGNIDAEAKARDAADKNLQANINNEAKLRDEADQNLQNNLNKAVSAQAGINDKLTTAVQNNSKAIVANAEAAKNLEKHLTETDGRVDKANAEIHTNAGNIAQSQKDIADIQDTLKNAKVFASANATKAANEAADNANKVAKGLKDRVDLISNNQNVTSESDLIKKDQSVGQNLTNVDTALHKEIAARIGADAAQDKRINEINTNVSNGFNAINSNIGTITGQLNKNDLAEQQARVAGDKAEAKARDAADKNLQANINNEAKLRDEADQNLQNNINNAVNAQAGINDTLTKAVTNNSKAIVANAEAAKNLEKHLNETDGRVDKANAEIHTNAGIIAQNKIDIANNKDAINKEVQDRTKAVADEADARTKAVADEAKARESGDNALQNQIKKESAARQADVSRLDNKIHDVSKEVDTVGALSMAMSGLHPLSYDEGDARFQLSAAVGTYDGTEALALGGFYHFNRDSMLSVGVATDLGADEHRMGANVGYTRRIGQGGHVSRPSEGTVSDIMKDIKNLEQKQAKLEQENEQLKQQLAALKK